MSDCNTCGTPAELRCGKCREVWYCSEECQRKDWKQHKRVCSVAATLGAQGASSTEQSAPSSRASLRVFKIPFINNKEVPVYVYTGHYSSGGSLTVGLRIPEDAPEAEEFGPEYGTVSVNLPSAPPITHPKQFYVKTWDDQGLLLRQLEEHGIVRVINWKAHVVNQWGSAAALAELLLSDSEVEAL